MHISSVESFPFSTLMKLFSRESKKALDLVSGSFSLPGEEGFSLVSRFLGLPRLLFFGLASSSISSMYSSFFSGFKALFPVFTRCLTFRRSPKAKHLVSSRIEVEPSSPDDSGKIQGEINGLYACALLFAPTYTHFVPF